MKKVLSLILSLLLTTSLGNIVLASGINTRNDNGNCFAPIRPLKIGA